MKCHAGVEFPSGKPCPQCGAKLGEVCWPGINADLLELKTMRATLKKPVAWRWRHKGSVRWEYGEEKPTGPSIHLFEVEALVHANTPNGATNALER